MMSNEVKINELEINGNAAFHGFKVKEFSIESEESWVGLEFTNAIEDSWFVVDDEPSTVSPSLYA